MQNLKQMTDRDEMNIYLDKFSKAQMFEIITELNKNLGKYSFSPKKSTTKNELKNIIVEHFMFQVMNTRIANRPYQHPYFH